MPYARAMAMVKRCQVGRLLVELAADEEFFVPLIDQVPTGAQGVR